MLKTITFLILFVTLNAFTQEYNVPYRKGNLWGFADKNGKIKVEPKYDSINPEMNNFRWFVYQNNKVGVINEKGFEVLKPIYDSIFRKPVHSRYNEFIIYKDNLTGYSDMDGEFLIPIQYKSINKAENDSFNELELKFFVQKNKDSNYKLINTNETEILTNIDDYREINNGFYIIGKENKFGVYNTIKNEWKINNEYDSIKYFDYKDFHEPKEPYESIKYYGIKEKVYYLFTIDFRVIKTTINKLEDFFNAPNMGDYEVMSVIGSTENARTFETKLVTGEAFVENNAYKSKDFYRTRLKIEIIKHKEKYSAITNSISFDRSKFKEYDEIKLVIKTHNDTYDCTFALVKSKKKWQILDLVKNEIIPNIEFDQTEFHEKFQDILILKNKSKIGTYRMSDDYNKEIAVVIEPTYDSISSFNYIYSLDDDYNSFKVCYFNKNGKLCPVGSNGVKYYED
ncbi:WG repeat-containing protein [uncultured Flavobacterium sp.]|uniref:WG repeat-containing protein n=1 Tax=uncultured Flavobacterium sp. TaxID=165435 RepID=UPI0030EF7D71|tara:strand:+ start:66 stop:1427 length:1362 start_codon:yes stop_codon:yes gene_type:complete